MKLEPAPNGFICPDDPGEPVDGFKRWSVGLDEARILSELFRGLCVLEIGTGLGIATNKIAEKAEWVYSVDIDPWVKENVVPTLARNVLFFDNIDHVPTDMEGAFIDGLHTYEQCLKDIVDARRIVKKGGLIVFHDANMVSIHQAVVDSGLRCFYIKSYAGMAMGWVE